MNPMPLPMLRVFLIGFALFTFLYQWGLPKLFRHQTYSHVFSSLWRYLVLPVELLFPLQARCVQTLRQRPHAISVLAFQIIFMYAPLLWQLLQQASWMIRLGVTAVFLIASVTATTTMFVSHAAQETLGYALVAYLNLGLAALCIAFDFVSFTSLMQFLASACIAFGALWLLMLMIQARIGNTHFQHVGGLVSKMPKASAFMAIFILGSIGLPRLLMSLPNEHLIESIAQESWLLATAAALILALLGIGLFSMFTRMFYGTAQACPTYTQNHEFLDLEPVEVLICMLLFAAQIILPFFGW